MTTKQFTVNLQSDRIKAKYIKMDFDLLYSLTLSHRRTHIHTPTSWILTSYFKLSGPLYHLLLRPTRAVMRYFLLNTPYVKDTNGCSERGSTKVIKRRWWGSLLTHWVETGWDPQTVARVPFWHGSFLHVLPSLSTIHFLFVPVTVKKLEMRKWKRRWWD